MLLCPFLSRMHKHARQGCCMAPCFFFFLCHKVIQKKEIIFKRQPHKASDFIQWGITCTSIMGKGQYVLETTKSLTLTHTASH